MPSTEPVIDLYSGVGGLSFGAVKAGFKLQAAVEYENRIIKSHEVNFPTSIHLCQDISKLSGKELLSKAKLKKKELVGLVGGPPCQGFSNIGKQHLGDSRNKLFEKFFHLVAETNPAFFLAENVPGILNEQYQPLLARTMKLVEKKYTVLNPTKIIANEFGAVTSRTRIFFIGVRKDIRGVENISESISRMKNPPNFFVKDALEGLPTVISEDWLDFESSWKRINIKQGLSYVNSLNSFIEGVGDTRALTRLVKKQEVSGFFGTRHSKEIKKRYSKLKPGQQDLVSKSVKLNPDGFCPTLRAGTDSTKGSFQAVRPIHYSESRVITPREAARLQGFPDWFQFHETKWHSFRQIGNSVCPIVAEKILLAIKNSLNM